MKRSLALCMTLLIFAGCAQAQLRKQRLFKVDPVSGLFKEVRVAVEHRLFGEFFGYIAPFGYHQTWLSRDRIRNDQPGFPQKYYGLGLRLGGRRYFFPAGESPEGFFLHAMAAYRHVWLQNLNDGLQITSKTRFHQLGIGATAGYQWLYGRKDNLVYGFMGGLEYYFNKFRAGEEAPHLVKNWYQFPFLPDFFNNFRIYLGVELGFAFLQKRLHW